MILKALTKMGATLRARGMIYKAVPHSVLMYNSESWVMTGEMLKLLEGFHLRMSRRTTGMTAKCVTDREWEYTPVVAALEAADLNPIKEYIRRRQVTIAAQVECRPIYELCTKVEQRPVMRRMVRWWDQDVVHECEE